MNINRLKLVLLAVLGLLVVAGIFLYQKLYRHTASDSNRFAGNAESIACGQLPQFEFLHVYNPINLAGGRFSFEKVGHLCLEKIETVNGQELLLHLTYNTGTGYARITLPARIMVATQRDPTRHGPVRVSELAGYLGQLPARVSIRLQYGVDIDNFDPTLAVAETKERMPSWAEYDWEAYYAPLATQSLSTEQLRKAMSAADTNALGAVVVMDVDRMGGI